jgi:hypothetical protein
MKTSNGIQTIHEIVEREKNEASQGVSFDEAMKKASE